MKMVIPIKMVNRKLIHLRKFLIKIYLPQPQLQLYGEEASNGANLSQINNIQKNQIQSQNHSNIKVFHMLTNF
jgi:hypothetical protein